MKQFRRFWIIPDGSVISSSSLWCKRFIRNGSVCKQQRVRDRKITNETMMEEGGL